VSTHGLIEISLSGLDDATTPSVFSLLNQWGRGGAVVEQSPGDDAGTTVKAYLLPEDEVTLRQIEAGLEVLSQARRSSYPQDSPTIHNFPEPRIRFLSETDWAEAWKTHYDVLRVGRRLVIKPTWRDYDPLPSDLIIELDPGMAFGSGLHPTTRLCLEAMEDFLRPGSSVLDVGTGSGILAVVAARLGASHVLALDIDPLAIKVARDNTALNQVEPVVQVEVGTVEIPNTKYQISNQQISKSANLQSPNWDMVVANILAETIVELMPALVANLAPKGVLVASGIIPDRAEIVIDSLHENDLALAERREDGEWLALIAREATKDRGPKTKDEEPGFGISSTRTPRHLHLRRKCKCTGYALLGVVSLSETPNSGN
jgi:ribosomal protein L11 methyltransferase